MPNFLHSFLDKAVKKV